MRLVAVTSCPTGIAHTYMAAESLEQSALAAGHEIAVEAQGAAGYVPLAADTIAAADAVILAADVEVRGRERFAGKPTVSVGVRRPSPTRRACSSRPSPPPGRPRAASAARAPVPGSGVEAEGPMPAAGPACGREPMRPGAGRPRAGGPGAVATHVRRWLMTGVGHMVPFVAAGGILISLSFLIAQLAGARRRRRPARHLPRAAWRPASTLPRRWSGRACCSRSAPRRSCCSSRSWPASSRSPSPTVPGLAPGFVGGAIAAALGTGFLGGIAAGLLGGLTALWVARWAVPPGVRRVLPVVVTPLVSTLLTGAALIVVLGRPLRAVSTGLSCVARRAEPASTWLCWVSSSA